MRDIVRTPVLTAALVMVALSGCLNASEPPAIVPDQGPPSVDDVVALLSPVIGDLPIIYEALDVATPHGAVRVDVWRPDTGQLAPDWKAPVILVASPYNNPLEVYGEGKDPENQNRVALTLYDWIERELVPRGYAFAQMDILGTRDSEGCQSIMDSREREATAAVIDDLGSREWTNGKVGMIGKSYLGASQMGAAIENPEHLATIVPISGPTHDYAYRYYNGVPYTGNQATNVLYHGIFSLPFPTDEPQDWAPTYPQRLLCAPENVAMGALPTGDYNEFWQERDYRPHIPNMRDDISVLFVHGLQDWNVKPDHILDVYNAFPSTNKMALLGQWHHDYPDNNRWDDETFGNREDWYYLLHRWFDHFLLERESGLLEEVAACPVQVQSSDAKWRCLEAYPAEPLVSMTLHPDTDGALTGSSGAGTLAYADPDANLAFEAIGPLGYSTSEVIELFPDELTFMSAPVESAKRVSGVPTLNVRIETTSPVNTYVSAALGVERDGVVDEFTWGFQSLRHRDGLEAGQPITPAMPYDVTFGLYPVDHVFEPGDVIVLKIRGHSGPEPNLGTIPNPTPGYNTVHLDGTSLELPMRMLDGEFEPLTYDRLPAGYKIE